MLEGFGVNLLGTVITPGNQTILDCRVRWQEGADVDAGLALDQVVDLPTVAPRIESITDKSTSIPRVVYCFVYIHTSKINTMTLAPSTRLCFHGLTHSFFCETAQTHKDISRQSV